MLRTYSHLSYYLASLIPIGGYRGRGLAQAHRIRELNHEKVNAQRKLAKETWPPAKYLRADPDLLDS